MILRKPNLIQVQYPLKERQRNNNLAGETDTVMPYNK